MKRTIGLLTLAVVVAAIYFAGAAEAQSPTPIPSVWLQTGSPTTQTGNIYLSGKGIFGGSIGLGMDSFAARLEILSGFAGDGARLSGTGTNSPNYMLLNGTSDAGLLGLCLNAGHYSTSSQVGDIVLRATTGRLILQTGSAGAGVYISGNRVGIGTVASGANMLEVSNGAAGGVGVYGYASASIGTGKGVLGMSESVNGFGVMGLAPNGVAVYGISQNYRGVLGAGAEYGVYAIGNSGASGTKSFSIDHPFDPLNKYLLHYCQEGPEPKNVYDGTVVTDENGAATVALPDYFDEINRAPRIQLTVDDTSDDFVMVKSAGGVKNASFLIRTSKPHVKVFWEVKATRNDKWVQKYGAPVEREKRADERGKYQHPELYGAPASMGMNYRMSK